MTVRDVMCTLGRGLPPRSIVIGYVGIALGFYLAEAAILAAVNWWVGEWLDAELSEQFSQPKAYNVVLAFGLGGVSWWRAGAYNPALGDSYHTWLRMTPWSAEKPLPLGPVHLLWQDALLVGAAICLWTLPESPLILLLAFALPYFGLMTRALYRAGQWWSVCGAAALGVSLILTINRPPWQAAAVAIGGCVYCDWAFRRALWRFPWEGAPAFTGDKPASVVSNHWPRLQVGGITTDEAAIAWRHVAAISLLVGWLALVLAALCSRESAATVSPEAFALRASYLLFLFALCGAMARAGVYANEREWPQGVWARMRLGRWIIPGYDRIFLAPMAIIATGAIMPQVMFEMGAPAPVVVGATVTCFMLIAFGAGPTLAEWSLTGAYRTRPRRSSKDWVQLA